MRKLDEYLLIKEAAEYLGVSPNTLRNWGASGKIEELRHPINGYRIYSTSDLDKLLQTATRSKPKTKPR
ncbi:MAG: helix-turn-helix domain-containing protein [bacterium]|nr:helix-turn-helix domain-containing protein [bacterium]